MAYLQENSRNAITVPKLQAMRAAGEKIVMLTCYDASFAALLDRAGVDILLIGDSLGNVIQGHSTTLPVTLEDIVGATVIGQRRDELTVLANQVVEIFDKLLQHLFGVAARRGSRQPTSRVFGDELIERFQHRGVEQCLLGGVDAKDHRFGDFGPTCDLAGGGVPVAPLGEQRDRGGLDA